jgi:hypothetical protein
MRLTLTSEHGGGEDGQIQTVEETCRSVTEYLKERLRGGFTHKMMGLGIVAPKCLQVWGHCGRVVVTVVVGCLAESGRQAAMT